MSRPGSRPASTGCRRPSSASSSAFGAEERRPPRLGDGHVPGGAARQRHHAFGRTRGANACTTSSRCALANRDAVLAGLHRAGIAARVHCDPPLHAQPPLIGHRIAHVGVGASEEWADEELASDVRRAHRRRGSPGRRRARNHPRAGAFLAAFCARTPQTARSLSDRRAETPRFVASGFVVFTYRVTVRKLRDHGSVTCEGGSRGRAGRDGSRDLSPDRRTSGQPPGALPWVSVRADTRRRAQARARAERTFRAFPLQLESDAVLAAQATCRELICAHLDPPEQRVPHPPGARRRRRSLGEIRVRAGGRSIWVSAANVGTTRRASCFIRPGAPSDSANDLSAPDPRSTLSVACGWRPRAGRSTRNGCNSVPASSSSTWSATAPAPWRTSRSRMRSGSMPRIATRWTRLRQYVHQLRLSLEPRRSPGG